MLTLILLLVFSLGVVYFAFENTSLIDFRLASYLFSDIPLYIVVIGSILTGLFAGWILSLVSSFSSFLTMRGKDSALDKAYTTIDDLKEKIHNLEIENAQLKGKYTEVETHEAVDQDETPSHRYNFLQGLRRRFA